MSHSSAQKGGYDVGIFVDQNSVADHKCAICQCVFNEPMSIGCDEGHVFCKQCLEDLFKDNEHKPCPLDQQMVHAKNISPNKFVARWIKNLRVVCPLQFRQSANLNVSSCTPSMECEWTGRLSDMDTHTREHCDLFVMQCQHCGNDQQRRDMNEHVENCDERLVPCSLQCSESIKRRLLAHHMDVECRMKLVNCDDCKESVLRKDLKEHQQTECEERLCKCPYSDYGCAQMGKARDLQAHVAQNEVKHLQLTVEKLVKDKDRMKQLESTVEYLKLENNSLENQNNRLCDEVDTPSKLVFLLKNKEGYVYDIVVNEKQEMKAASFMNENLGRFCMGGNISFSSLRQIGFEPKRVDFRAKNNVLFGVSVSLNSDKNSFEYSCEYS